jgi:DNA-binding beta-propeller fold protein YncE
MPMMNKNKSCRKCIKKTREFPKRCYWNIGRFVFELMFIFFITLSATPAFGIKIIHIDFLFDISSDFKEPSDVSVSKNGNIYVVDGVNNKIKVFKNTGEALSSFGEKGADKGRFQYPLGIDVDNAGNIYIADSGNNRVQIFNRDNMFASMIQVPEKNGKPADPTDVAVDESLNRLYIVDNDNHRLMVYDLSTLKLLKAIGVPGEQELMFRYPFFIALDKEHYIYVVDVINTRVQVINPDGLFVTYIGSWGVEKGQFFRPKGVAVDSDNRIYVSDSYMGVIQVFNTLGEFYGVLGDAKKQTVQKFKTPVGICIDDHNRLYVVEMLAQKVSVYRIHTDGK